MEIVGATKKIVTPIKLLGFRDKKKRCDKHRPSTFKRKTNFVE